MKLIISSIMIIICIVCVRLYNIADNAEKEQVRRTEISLANIAQMKAEFKNDKITVIKLYIDDVQYQGGILKDEIRKN